MSYQTQRMPNRQGGVALIMVLLAMALVVMLAAGMTQQQSVRVFRATHYFAQQQGHSVALGAEAYVRSFLVEDFEEDQDDNEMWDSLDEDWAGGPIVYPVDESLVEGEIKDLGGRINLNDLVTANGEVNPITRDRLTRLFQILDITSVHVDALIDWIDLDDQTISANGAEDGVYLSNEPAYRAGNQPFVNVSELLLIGMSREDYDILRSSYVAALPVKGLGINVNTAEEPVLRSLHVELGDDGVEEILKNRPFKNIQEFLALPAFAGSGLKPTGLGVQARFFELRARVTYDNRVANLVSILYRSPEGEMRTVSRDIGEKVRFDKELSSAPEQ